MNTLAENVGWLLFLAAALTGGFHLIAAVYKLTWDSGAKGETIDVYDALIATGRTVSSWFKLVKSNWSATVCAVATFLFLWVYTSTGFYVSLGYSAMTFIIGGLLTPMVLRRIKPFAGNVNQAVTPDESFNS